MKRVILELPSLTTPAKEETLYVYLAAAAGAVLADFLSEALARTPSERILSSTSPNEKQGRREEVDSLHDQGLRLAKKMTVQDIKVKVDSKLVKTQINKSYVANSTSMIKYLVTARECITGFKSFAIQNIPRNLNQKADILSKLATHAFDHLTKKSWWRTTTSLEKYTWDHTECTSKRGCNKATKSKYNTKLNALLHKQVYAHSIVDWRLLNEMGYREEIEEMLEIKVMGGDEEMFTSKAWRPKNQDGYANVAWVIAKWMKKKGVGSQRDNMI
nr:reverse transcriptase domain-containing protein [Tanacetum cinerariifolium]